MTVTIMTRTTIVHRFPRAAAAALLSTLALGGVAGPVAAQPFAPAHVVAQPADTTTSASVTCA